MTLLEKTARRRQRRSHPSQTLPGGTAGSPTADHKRLGLSTCTCPMLFLVAGGVLGVVLAADLPRPKVRHPSRRRPFFRLSRSRHGDERCCSRPALGRAGHLPDAAADRANRLPASPPRGRLLAVRHRRRLPGGVVHHGPAERARHHRQPALGRSLPTGPTGPPSSGSPAWPWWPSPPMLAPSIWCSRRGTPHRGMTTLRIPAFSWVAGDGGHCPSSRRGVLAGLLLLYFRSALAAARLRTPGPRGARSCWQHPFGSRPARDFPADGCPPPRGQRHRRHPCPSPLLDHRVAHRHARRPSACCRSGPGPPATRWPPPSSCRPTPCPRPWWWRSRACWCCCGWAHWPRGKPRFHVSLLFRRRLRAALAAGAANVIVAAVQGRRRGHALVRSGILHTGMPSRPRPWVAVGAVLHWPPSSGPQSLGRRRHAGVPPDVRPAPRHGADELPPRHDGGPPTSRAVLGKSSWQSHEPRRGAGGGLVGARHPRVPGEECGATVARSQPVGDNPYEGLTLEWATTSRRRPTTFDNVPEVRSARPAGRNVRTADAAEGVTPDGRRRRDPSLPPRGAATGPPTSATSAGPRAVRRLTLVRRSLIGAWYFVEAPEPAFVPPKGVQKIDN